jgi:uncharacterized ubiquitin-like protein YukD
MEQDYIIVTFFNHKTGERADLELPRDIRASDLIIGLNQGFNLGLDTSDLTACFLRSEQPVALLSGARTLRQYGLRDGSIIHHM